MADNEKILEALQQLDPLDDDQWTSDGAPKIESVSSILGEKIVRQDIVNAAPDFSRQKAGDPNNDEKPQETEELQQPEELEEFQGDFEEASFRKWLAGVPREGLEGAAADAKKAVDAANSQIEKIKLSVQQMKYAAGLIKLRIQSEYPNSTDAEATRQFIASQTASRASRVQNRNVILHGIRPEELDYRAPIDAAMARKTRRGTSRPKFSA